MNNEELSQMLDEAVSIVREAGKVIVEAIRKEKTVAEKAGKTDLVTETDQNVEDFIRKELGRKYPGHKFIGEESTSAAAETGLIGEFDRGFVWILDPIDGTMNFVHSNPMVSVSLALTFDRRVQLGIVYLPCLDKLYTARRGAGARLNGEPINVSKCSKLDQSMVIYELWANTGDQVTRSQMDVVTALMPKVHAVRSIGSAAINLALVAAGQADVYFQAGYFTTYRGLRK